MKKTKKNSFKSYFQAFKKVVKLRTLIFIIILLASNTFAWFIYNFSVEGGLTTHVRAWKVTFVRQDEVIEDEVSVDIPDIYPGMDDYETSFTAQNESEVKAKISFVLLRARVLDEEYVTDEGAGIYEIPSSGISSDELLSKLENDYPFKINLSVYPTIMDEKTGTSELVVDVAWPYESGDDELDTYYGIKASEYQRTHPADSSIRLDVLIRIVQAREE